MEMEEEAVVTTSLREEFDVLISDPFKFYRTVIERSGEYSCKLSFSMQFEAWRYYSKAPRGGGAIKGT